MGYSLTNHQISAETEQLFKDMAQCRPKKRSCSKAGTGPWCSNDRNSEDAGADKKACLKNVKRQCEDKRTECKKKCDEKFAKDLATADPNKDRKKKLEDWWKKYQADERAKDPNYKPSAEEQESIDQQLEDITWAYGGSGIKGINADGPLMVKLSDYGMSVQCVLYRGDTNDFEYTHFLEAMEHHAECYSNCYHDSTNNCATSHCYCNLLNCESGGNGASGGFNQFPQPPDPDKPKDDSKNPGNPDFDTHSQYGIPIELVYTRSYMPGNIIWIDNLVTSRTQKAFTSTDDITASLVTNVLTLTTSGFDMLIGLCAGEIADVPSIRVDGSPVYEKGMTNTISDSVRVLKGSPNQKVQKEMALSQGFGRTPAHRDLACVLLKNFSFNTFGKFPQMSIEVTKKVTAHTLVTSSVSYPDKAPSELWTVHPESKRLYFGTTTGVHSIDYKTMETIMDATLDSPIEITPMGRVLNYDSVTNDVEVYEREFDAVSGSFTAHLPITQSFIFRANDTAGNAGTSLLIENANGDAFINEVDELRPLFPQDDISLKNLSGLDKAVHSVGLTLNFQDNSIANLGVPRRSYLLLRVYRDIFDTVRIRELRMMAAASEKLLENEEWYEYDINPDVFGQTTNLTITGSITCPDNSIIVFTTDGTLNYAVKWNPINGVIWNVLLPAVPLLGKYSGVRDTAFSTYYFINSGKTVYSLNITTGAYSVVPNTDGWPENNGLQYYDPVDNIIIYEGDNDTIVSASIYSVSNTKETFKDVVEDLATRSGLDLSDISANDVATVGVTGFRSGDFNSAADILSSLKTIYQVYSNDTYRVIFRLKSYSALQAVNPYDSSELPPRTRRVLDPVNSSVLIQYLNAEANGEPSNQQFSIYQNEQRSAPDTENTYTFSALETNNYMLNLAEVIAYTSQAPERDEALTLPPKYLALEAGDPISVQYATPYGARAYRISIGEDTSIAVDSYADSPEKYEDFVELSSVGTISHAQINKAYPELLEAPLVFSARAIDPNYEASTGLYYGVSNTEKAYRVITNVAQASSESISVPTGQTLATAKPVAWGRLRVLPKKLTAYNPQFKTFKDDSLTIEFADEEFATRVLAQTSFYGKYPDQRTVDSYYNLLLVGYEFIQYGRAERHPVNPRSIIFRNLLRARQNTDEFTSQHVAGEFCALITKDTVKFHEVDASAAGASGKTMSYGNTGAFRRGDTMLDERALAPVSPGYALRFDAPYTGNALRYPGNLNTFILLRLRDNSGISLEDDKTNLITNKPFRDFNPVAWLTCPYGESFTHPDGALSCSISHSWDPNKPCSFWFETGRPTPVRARRNCDIYFLREAYDEERFNAARFVGETDKSYIFLHSSLLGYENGTYFDAVFVYNSPYYSLVYREPESEQDYENTFWISASRNIVDHVGWDNSREPLVAVLIQQTEYGESRSVFSWPVGDYTKRPTRGNRYL